MNFLKDLSARKRQVLMLLVVTILGAAAGIVHGIYFDLDFSQIKRLSLLGVIVTTFIVFPAILFFEYIFDWNNNEKMISLEDRIKYLEVKLNKK